MTVIEITKVSDYNSLPLLSSLPTPVRLSLTSTNITMNTPFLSCLSPLFQSDSQCETFHLRWKETAYLQCSQCIPDEHRSSNEKCPTLLLFSQQQDLPYCLYDPSVHVLLQGPEITQQSFVQISSFFNDNGLTYWSVSGHVSFFNSTNYAQVTMYYG